MFLFYNIIINFVSFLLKFIRFFNKKIGLFVDGRKDLFKNLASKNLSDHDVVWFHCASLGEFEQGRPILEYFKSHYPNHKILVTFFSPSGYEIRKEYAAADVVTYLPLDTRKNAKKFIELVKPQLAVFIKYEFWPNILKELKTNHIKTILVSGIFRENQVFFKWYGGWARKFLSSFDHFFVQNDTSKALLNHIGIKNTTVSGDTRFDRVFEISKQDNHIDFIAQFTDQKKTLVAGSTWPQDEELLVNYINEQATDHQKFIIAPHNITIKGIEKLKSSLTKSVVLFSDSEKTPNSQILIIDSIGLLTKIYSYAHIAYVGGGFGTDIHNILEPATFGIPILIGPKYQKFNEAKELVHLKACLVVENQIQFNAAVTNLFNDHILTEKKGTISKEYILKNKGATKTIFNYIFEIIPRN